VVAAGARIVVVAGTTLCTVQATVLVVANVICARIRVVARNLHAADALAFRTLVSKGAWVVIVAGNGVVGEDTAFQVIANIVGTDGAVVTVYGAAHALAVVAVISQGASIAVGTVTVSRFVTAPKLPAANVLGARIAVVAARLVGHTIAIIVYSVAHFGSWRQRIARCWNGPCLCAKQLSIAYAILVFHKATGGESQLRRGRAASADIIVSHALERRHSLHRLNFFTRVSFQALLLIIANCPAEAAFRIGNTNISDAVGSTVSAGHTGLAELREAGHAEVYEVCAETTGVFALPAFRALLDALLGAEPVTQVLNAEPGGTVSVCFARVKHASQRPITGRQNIRQQLHWQLGKNRRVFCGTLVRDSDVEHRDVVGAFQVCDSTAVRCTNNRTNILTASKESNQHQGA
jgi:hypothetical protein